MSTFTSVLDAPVILAEKPKPIPVGHYVASVASHKFEPEVGKNKTPLVTYELNLLQAQPDVDQEQLTSQGGLAGKKARLTFWLSEDAIYRYKAFLQNTCEIDLGTETAPRKLRELLPEPVGRQFMIEIKHRPYTDAQNEAQIGYDVASTAKL